MGKKVEKLLRKIKGTGATPKERLASKIKIAKSRGLIRQAGRHLALGKGK